MGIPTPQEGEHICGEAQEGSDLTDVTLSPLRRSTSNTRGLCSTALGGGGGTILPLYSLRAGFNSWCLVTSLSLQSQNSKCSPAQKETVDWARFPQKQNQG